MEKVKIGIIGCGDISNIYLKNCTEVFKILDVIGCADLIKERAEEKAAKFNIKAYSVDELLSDKEIQIVVNLTIPKAHAEVSLSALKANKNVYSEKTLAINREDANKVLELAKEKNLLVGCAPDTFMGAGIQTCRKILDEGKIGDPVAGNALLLYHGNEFQHPNPEFFYKQGGGPLLDMGPYYINALICLIGPVKKVTGMTKMSFPERTVEVGPKKGKKIKVETDTHITGLLEFVNGTIVTLITTFDVWNTRFLPPFMEIYGSSGTLATPFPHEFGGEVSYSKPRPPFQDEWEEIPLTQGYVENSRGLGLADMAYALISGREHRANGEMAYHALDVMLSIIESSKKGEHILLQSTCKRPKPLPEKLKVGTLDR